MRLVKYVIVVAAGMLLLSSCASMRKGSSRFDSSESIYVKEEPRKVEVNRQHLSQSRNRQLLSGKKELPLLVRLAPRVNTILLLVHSRFWTMPVDSVMT